MDLAGSFAVVTGATEGIGRATALALGRAGSRVAICARTEANVHATVRDLKSEGIDCIGMPCDVSDPARVEAFAAFVSRERGAPQVLVNNAGIGRFRPLVELSLEDGCLRLQVRDDGVGGADLSAGSGLRGLRDRVDALDGHLELDSPPGGGTTLTVEIPVEPD